MPVPTYHTDYHPFHEAIIGFAQYARSYDLNVGLEEAQEALKIASLGMIGKKNEFKYGLKSLFCC